MDTQNLLIAFIFIGAGYVWYSNTKGTEQRVYGGSWYSNAIMDFKTDLMLQHDWPKLYKIFGTRSQIPSEETRFDFEFAQPDPFNLRINESRW